MNLSKTLVWPKHLHWEKYFRPQTIPEALGLLEKYKGSARIIAGGTDLLLQIRNGDLEPKALVDITRIPGLDRVRLEGGRIKIGGVVTHTQVVQSRLIEERAMALKEGASWLGSPQIRNIGTLSGNIVSGQPGADTTIPLLALNAQVKVVNKKGERIIPLAEFFIDTGKTAVDSSREILTEVSFPALKKGETSISLRLARRKALALPILSLAIVLSADLAKRKFKYARIAMGPVGPIPFRARETENLLAGAPISEAIIKEAAQKAAQESNPRTSLLRGSEGYRRNMVANLVERGIRIGIERLEGKNV